MKLDIQMIILLVCLSFLGDPGKILLDGYCYRWPWPATRRNHHW